MDLKHPTSNKLNPIFFLDLHFSLRGHGETVSQTQRQGVFGSLVLRSKVPRQSSEGVLKILRYNIFHCGKNV